MESVIKKVSVEYSEKLNGRILRIKSKKINFKTPSKAPNTSEINSKNNIFFDEAYYNPLFEITQNFTKIKVSDLYTRNGVFARKISQLLSYTDAMWKNSLVKYYPQINNKKVLNKYDLRILIDLQLESNNDIISLPEITDNASLNDFSKNIEKFWEYTYSMNPHAVFMPYINLKQKNTLFEKKLKLLGEYEGMLNCIGIEYGPINECMDNLHTLSEFHDKDFWIHLSQCRNDKKTKINQLHLFQKYNIDTISNAMFKYGNVKNVLNTPYFNRKNLKIEEIKKTLHNNHLTCDCPICQKQSFDKITDEANSFSRVHEVFASNIEFEKSKEYIENGELNEYFNSKNIDFN